MTNYEAVLEAIDNGRPFSWLPRGTLLKLISMTTSEGERLHEIYDGNGRLRSNGGFCGD
jgi:hypothetical protein